MDTDNITENQTGDNNDPNLDFFDFSQYRDSGGIHYSEFCDSDDLPSIVQRIIEDLHKA